MEKITFPLKEPKDSQIRSSQYVNKDLDMRAKYLLCSRKEL